MHARGPVELERRAIRVCGLVQGVGFRPAVYRLASQLGLGGFVHNDLDGVWIEIEGDRAALDHFMSALTDATPAGARIDRLEARAIAARDDGAFRIAPSPATTGAAAAAIPMDLAPCDDCVRELFDPNDRRYRYPFINCTACGPRFTIVREVPYDRARTTMATFVLCEVCRREYGDPGDRRFHAEPNACAVCGPQVQLVTREGRAILDGDAAIKAAALAISDGAIVAIKGAGGYVLATDATSSHAVERLRARKRRPHKPFAVMGRSLAELERVAMLDDTGRAAVSSRVRPIVLAPLVPGVVADSIAPGLADIGVFLAPTPLQLLLAADGPSLQVMTSGNLAEEPIARGDDEARVRLANVADLWLVHDREVYSRADDSVVRGRTPIRRARGLVPDPIALPVPGPALLAVGGHERNTVCVAHGGQAVLSQHVGDLDHPDAVAFLSEAIAHLTRLRGVVPEVVAHDLHPDYASTRWARAAGLPAIAVQHHHAHVAACLCEHGRSERVAGVAFDGTGLGDDGTLWGGEFLDADLCTSHRLGRLRPLALVGGEAAIREPWRLAAAALLDAGEPLDVLPIPHCHDAAAWARDLDRIRLLVRTDLPAHASGAGRWFDAIAALLGVAGEVSYDGQAATQLEALAWRDDGPPLELAITDGVPDANIPFEIDLRPAVRELAAEIRRDATPSSLAARFHATMARAIQLGCTRVGRPVVALSGGCFVNQRMLAHATALLTADGFDVLAHRRVPPNDGGLALGQAAVASARLGGAACV